MNEDPFERLRRIQATMPLRRPQTPEEAHALAMSRGALCLECERYAKKTGPVPSTVVPGSSVTVVGELPGPTECEDGENFIGESGRVLNDAIAAGGVPRSRLTVINVGACMHDRGPSGHDSLDTYLTKQRRKHRAAAKPALDAYLKDLAAWQAERVTLLANRPLNAKGKPISAAKALKTLRPKPAKPKPPPFVSMLDCCRPRLIRDLQEAGSGTLLAVGGKALEALADVLGLKYGPNTNRDKVQPDDIVVESIKTQTGLPVPLPPRCAPHKVLIASLHPAYGMRDKAYMDVVVNDIARAARIAVRGHVIDWTPTPLAFGTTVEIVEQYGRWFIEARRVVSTDIETNSLDPFEAKIRCIGFQATAVEGQRVAISIPLYHMDGRPYWYGEARLRVEAAVRDVLTYCAVSGQNVINFDFGVLAEAGFLVDRFKPAVDTYLLFKSTPFGETDRRLQSLAARLFEVSPWKGDADKASLARDLAILLKYNGVDIDVVDRAWPILWAEVQKRDNVKAYEVDSKASPLMRERGSLGLFIDEQARGELSKMINEAARVQYKRFQEAAGRVDFLSGAVWKAGKRKGLRKVAKGLNPRSPQQIQQWLYGDLGFDPPQDTEGNQAQWYSGDPRDELEIPDDEGGTGLPSLMALYYTRGPESLEPRTREALDALIKYKCIEGTRKGIDKIPTREDVRVNAHVARYNGGVVPYVEAVTVLDEVTGEVVEILPRRPRYTRLRLEYKFKPPNGRLSASPSYVQNTGAVLWNGANLRRMFVALPGMVWVVADMKAIELRSLASRSHDELMLDAFRRELDPHTLNVAVMYSKPNDDIDAIMKLYGFYNGWKTKNGGTPQQEKELKQLRTTAKRGKFAPGYGQTLKTFWQRMRQERDKAMGTPMFPEVQGPEGAKICAYWYERFFEMSPNTKVWHAEVEQSLKQRGWVSDRRHRRKRWVHDLPEALAHEISTESRSYVIDASFAIEERWPMYSRHEFQGWVYDCHDAIGGYVLKEDAEQAKKDLLECMTFMDDPLVKILPDPDKVIVMNLAEAG